MLSRRTGLPSVTCSAIGKPPVVALAITFLCWCGSGALAQSGGSPSPSSGLTQRVTISNGITIGPGDVIDVQVFNTPELSAKYQVGQNGTIRLPQTGDIPLGGLTPTAAAEEVEKKLRDLQIMLNPQVSIFLSERAPRVVSVMGEVNHPGSYVLTGSMTLDNAIAAAGGVTAHEGSTITVTHPGNLDDPDVFRTDEKHILGDQPFYQLQSGDSIQVSQAGFIYVVGDVAHPGQFFLSVGRPLRALEALALAEGAKPLAKLGNASIIRSTPAGIETIHVNLEKAAKNLAQDPGLEPSDILVIPHSGLREFVVSVLPGLTGAAANAVALALVTK